MVRTSPRRTTTIRKAELWSEDSSELRQLFSDLYEVAWLDAIEDLANRDQMNNPLDPGLFHYLDDDEGQGDEDASR